jgi:hypothetical protein
MDDFPWRLEPFVDSDLDSDFKCRDAGHQAHRFQALIRQNHPLPDFELEGGVDPPFQLQTHLQTFSRLEFDPRTSFLGTAILTIFSLVASDTSVHTKKSPKPSQYEFYKYTLLFLSRIREQFYSLKEYLEPTLVMFPCISSFI